MTSRNTVSMVHLVLWQQKSHWIEFEELCYVKHQSIFVVIETTSKEYDTFESGTAPLFCSIVTSLGRKPHSLCNILSTTF